MSTISPSCSTFVCLQRGPSRGSEFVDVWQTRAGYSKVRVCGRDHVTYHVSLLKSVAGNDFWDPRRSPGLNGYWRRHGTSVNVSRDPLPYFEAPVRAGLKRFAETSSDEAILPRCADHQSSLIKSSGHYCSDRFLVLCVAPRRYLFQFRRASLLCVLDVFTASSAVIGSARCQFRPSRPPDPPATQWIEDRQRSFSAGLRRTRRRTRASSEDTATAYQRVRRETRRQNSSVQMTSFSFTAPLHAATVRRDWLHGHNRLPAS